MIQHKDIPNDQLHEPKGASSASNLTVYVANGAGSGVFRRIDTSDLVNVNVDLNQTNRLLASDGAGNVITIIDKAYGVMAITDNTTGFAVTAAVDSTLNTDTDYVVFSGTGAAWAGESLFGVTYSSDRLTIVTPGVYRLDFWADLTGFPNNMGKIAVKYKVNGTTLGPRKVQAKSNSAGDSGNLNGFGLLTLNAGDYVQVALASSHTGNVILNSANLTLSLVRQI